MAWIFLIKGAHFQINLKDPGASQDFAESLKAHAEYRALQVEAQAAGLLLQASNDEELGGVDVFLGEELHGDRHTYAGQTFSWELPETKPEYPALSDRLETLLKNMGHAIKRTDGIVLNQFD